MLLQRFVRSNGLPHRKVLHGRRTIRAIQVGHFVTNGFVLGDIGSAKGAWIAMFGKGSEGVTTHELERT